MSDNATLINTWIMDRRRTPLLHRGIPLQVIVVCNRLGDLLDANLIEDPAEAEGFLAGAIWGGLTDLIGTPEPSRVVADHNLYRHLGDFVNIGLVVPPGDNDLIGICGAEEHCGILSKALKARFGRGDVCPGYAKIFLDELVVAARVEWSSGGEA